MRDEHRGGLLNVVATSVEEGIERKLRTPFQIISLSTPSYGHVTEGRFFCDIAKYVTKEPSLCYIQANAHWGLLFEGLQVAIEACLTHQLPRSPYKILR